MHFWNLSAYVGGHLIGGWVDLDDHSDADEFKAKVFEVTKGAEEIILGDYESDYGISVSEYPDLDRIWETHEALCEIAESDRDAFSDYLAHIGGMENLDEALSKWQDAYCGRYDSIEDYAWHMADELYPELAHCPAGFQVTVDTIAWEQDHWISSGGNVFRYM
ncbi:antirestriction protein ArdA [Streptosporangium sp. NPDC000239]|uniref:antirestriction protein ArdA n=1 Tax=Streptosporangium sp. NPDC000239 TaxID=3154248 RepID=UPI003333F6A4